MLTISSNPSNPTQHMTIDQKINEKFPIIFGIPGSWADITEYAESLMVEMKMKKKNKNKEKGWETVTKPKKVTKPKTATKNNTKKQSRGDTLILKNIPKNIPTDSQRIYFQKLFRDYGRIVRINVLTNGIAFVKFSNKNDVVNAMISVPYFIMKGKRITVNIV